MRQPFRKRCVSRAARGSQVLAAAAIAFALMPPENASAAYTFKRLHAFCSKANCADGAETYAGLVMDQNGNLYGTTSARGKYNNGVVFKLVPNADKSAYTYYFLHNFCARQSCADGAIPFAGLIMDVDGNLYGTTWTDGGEAGGVVFKLTHVAHGWKLGVLKQFCSVHGCTDGAQPIAGLSYAGQDSGQAWDEFSPLFGTTSQGGTYNNGVAYELTSDGSLWNYTVIHNFQSGSDPQELLVDSAGNIYGTTSHGGSNSLGLMYKLANGTWKQTILHNFCNSQNCSDGSMPYGRLLRDRSGNLFGTTSSGGTGLNGADFERTSGGTYKVLYNFCSQAQCKDGEHPIAGLIMDSSGNVFGTTRDGGDYGWGTVFELSGGTHSVLRSFCSPQNCNDGANLSAALIFGSSGELLGTTTYGGPHGEGTVFRLGSP